MEEPNEVSELSETNEVSVSASIGSVDFENCIWNAAGPRCSSVEELKILEDCTSNGAIVTKTCTLKMRMGNSFPRVYSDAHTTKGTISVNSVGLANLGIDEYLEYIRTRETSKPIFLSIGGLSLRENKDLLTKIRLQEVKPDFIELNLSCPNIENSGIVGYDHDNLKRYLTTFTIQIGLMKADGVVVSCGVKLPPYFGKRDFDAVAAILNTFKEDIDFVTTINGVPGGLVIDIVTERSMIKPKGGMGGMGGTIVKPIGLANVAQMRRRLSPEIKIVGCGGVKTGADVFEYILAGAEAVEVATQFLIEGVECFERILGELVLEMKTKGYRSLEDFRGNFLRNCLS